MWFAYRRGTARRCLSVEIFDCTKSHFNRLAVGEWHWKSLKVIRVYSVGWTSVDHAWERDVYSQKNDLYDLLLMVSSYSVGMWPTNVSVTLRSPLVLNQLNKAVTVPDLSMWRPWAGSLLEAPTHPQMLYFTCTYNCNNSKYIYIYFYTL